MKIMNKAPFVLIILIAGYLIFGGLQRLLFGIKAGYIEIILGAIIFIFMIIYFKFMQD